MNRNCAAKILLLALIAGTAAAISLADAMSDRIERGKYLVEEVAQCGMCHSPRNDRGEADLSRRLQGAPIWFNPTRSVPNWAYTAPAIAGLGGFTREQVKQVLEKGVGPQGTPVRQPMHRYHMTAGDADAIVEYLASLR